MTTIEARQLSEEYDRTRAADHVTLDVLPDQETAFLGPNGAGKSTAMRLVFGLEHPASGTATVGGQRCAVATQLQRLPQVRVCMTDPALLRATLARGGIEPVPEGSDHWLMPSEQADRLGPMLCSAEVPILELTDRQTTLEQALRAPTATAADYTASAKKAA
ncbi:ATP-binding cassette domain-containing protein [Nocardia stercoris]|uniref:ATP-binding cassette domain-containing protein n=1 Tax=Nocardia stercoris TaxID=2483361 RepID=A0A3M2LCH3_9NOCA|nr:ATP-binding cassette domain-containing protein [Nocardia stercoris]